MMDPRVHVLTIAGFQYKKGDIVSRHIHDYFQLFYIVEGTATFFYADDQISLSTDEFLMVAPRVIHGMLPSKEQHLVILDIKFEINDIELLKGLIRYDIKCGSCDQYSKNLFQMMFFEGQQKKGYYSDILSNLLSAIIYVNLQNSMDECSIDSFDNTRYNKLGSCARATLRYVEGCVLSRNDQSLDNIAKVLGYNKTYMSRSFSEEIGISITQYLTLLRIDKAKELLLTTDFDIKHISNLLNYNDVPHFIKTFRNNVGLSPGEYRKKRVKEDPYLRYSFRLDGHPNNKLDNGTDNNDYKRKDTDLLDPKKK